jgi:hypothetical protein
VDWLDLVGWGGSALLVFSLLQARVLRFRTLNTIGCAVLIFFNAMIGVWPMVAMNIVLGAINIWFIAKLIRERHDQGAFEVLGVGLRDDYLRHILRIHEPDILRYQPDFVWDPDPDLDLAYIVMRGDETVGVVLLRRDGDIARILLDYVTPRYRDFSPGEFVWRRSTVLRERGFNRVVTPAHMVGAYYGRLGFEHDPDNNAWSLDL